LTTLTIEPSRLFARNRYSTLNTLDRFDIKRVTSNAGEQDTGW